MPVGDIYEVRFGCRLFTQTSYNVRHYLVTQEAATPMQPLQVAIAADEAFAPFYRAILCSEASYVGAGARRITDVPATPEAVASNFSGPGLITGQALAPQTAGLITLATGLGGRRGRGRLYAPFPSEESNQAGGTPNSQYVDDLGDLAEQLLSGLTIPDPGGNGMLIGVVRSRVGSQSNQLTLARAKQEWATQRRRSYLSGSDDPPFGL